MPHMQILTSAEQRRFDAPPLMSAPERKSAFGLPITFERSMADMRDPVHQMGFVLNAGYFRYSRRCFAPEQFHTRDITSFINHLGRNPGVLVLVVSHITLIWQSSFA
jgi:hypothetical protein